MKHLIKKMELVAYLEGTLNNEEIMQLKRKLRDNGELELLYHLQLSYEERIVNYAKELIGEDDFYIEPNSSPTTDLDTGNTIKVAASKTFTSKE